VKLIVLDSEFSVCRFERTANLPLDLFVSGNFTSITKTRDEVSIVVESARTPYGSHVESGWRMLRIEGSLSFGMVGVLSSISKPLAEAGISIFVISTYDTDYILVKEINLDSARTVLNRSGFSCISNKPV